MKPFRSFRPVCAIILSAGAFSQVAPSPAAAAAAEIWTASSGLTTIHFNTDIMSSMGLSLAEVVESRGIESAPQAQLPAMEGPGWQFRFEGSDLRFPVDRGRVRWSEDWTGSLNHVGQFAFRTVDDGQLFYVEDFIVQPADHASIGPRFEVTDSYGLPVFEMVDGYLGFYSEDSSLQGVTFDLTLSSEFAQRMGSTRLAGRTVGTVALRAHAQWLHGDSPELLTRPAVGDTCLNRDIALGALNRIEYWNRSGSYPNGVLALSMATTSCNLGECDVEWEAPMAVDHPGILMSLYRIDTAGVLEQIGISETKHAFFALSGNQCGDCPEPSDGTYLAVGCSDTYSVSANADRNYLAPRDEWLAYTASWDCFASHFTNGNPDCERVHGGSGHGPIDHRLQVSEAELADTSAAYFYEASYLVRGDIDKSNNIGWQPTSFERDGNDYLFDGETTVDVNIGPLLETWGDVHEWVSFEDDGSVLVATKVIEPAVGQVRLEYAILNFDADRQIFKVSIPVGSANLSSIGFNDPNLNVLDDWSAVVNEGKITWTTTNNPLSFGQMFNFRYSFPGEAEDGQIEVSTVMGGAETKLVNSKVPSTASSAPGTPLSLQLGHTPNPLSNISTIRFELPNSTPASLQVFDVSGRRVRSLIDGLLPSGPQRVEWDGLDDGGLRVRSGVYYYRLQAGPQTEANSITVID